MKVLILAISLFLFSGPVFTNKVLAQTKEPGSYKKRYGKKFDQPPVFPGGASAFATFLKKNIKYPKEAALAKAEGIVQIQVNMDVNGQIVNAKVYKDPVGHGCAEEALRVIKLMPAWAPAKAKGKPVQCTLNIPIKFALPKK